MDKRQVGILLLVLGGGGLLFSLNMETSVSTDFGRVNNIGLMKDQQNYLLLSAVAAISGLLLFIFSGHGQASSVLSGDATGNLRACPTCAESIKAQAIKCRFCGADVEPMPAQEAFESDAQAELTASDLENLKAFYGIVQEGDRYSYKGFKARTLGEVVLHARKQRLSEELLDART